ncbi:MAG: methyltransferase domain-containing protein [Synechocystis sp.]|nr:methyltransferase domain-containing protein [Synechocystis sp.]
MTYEYQWKSAAPSHSHNFYIPALSSLLPSSVSQTGEKLRLLDLGCGNGSLTNIIAQQGFDVTGIEESASGVALASQAFPQINFQELSLYSPPPDRVLELF